MTELFKKLQEDCEEAGTNITEVCREAKLNRSSIEKWKKETPLSIENLNKINAIIAEKKALKK